MVFGKKLVLMMGLMVFFAGSFGLKASGQQLKLVDVGKSGKFHLGSDVRLGDQILKSGMYRVKVVKEGGQNIIVFNEVVMGYRGNMGNQRLGKEVARLTGKTQLIEEKRKNTKLFVTMDGKNERRLVAIQLADQNLKLVFPESNSSQRRIQ